MQSSIDIPDNIAPMTVKNFQNFTSSQQKNSLPNEDIGHNITNHIGANHPETLSLIRQNIKGVRSQQNFISYERYYRNNTS